MDKEMKTLIVVGIVSSVAAWGITIALDRWMDRSGRYGERQNSRDLFTRNRVLAGAGTSAAFR